MSQRSIRWIFMVLASVVLGACSDTDPATNHATTAETPEASRTVQAPLIPRDPAGVYAALLEDDPCIPLSGGAATRRIVKAVTIPLGPFRPASQQELRERFGSKTPVFRKGLFRDFLTAEKQEVSLSALEITSDLTLEIWSEDECAEFLQARGRKIDEVTERFRLQYGDSTGMLQFSRVGFSDDGRQALVYITRWMGFQNGSGWFSLLEYTEDGGWVEVGYGDCWIS